MSAPVALVSIHHEGAGTPSDDPRGAGGGYSYWIGATKFERLRTPWDSFATLHFNHVSLDLCLSGDRMTSPVTDNDIALIRGAVTEARALGYVVGSPLIRAHRNSPGSSTVCPGDNTMNRWAAVVAACTATFTPLAPKEPPMLYPSAHQPNPTKFRGAQVDLANKHVALLGAAECNPAPVIANPNAWIGSYGGPGFFTIVTADLDEYRFSIP